MPTAAAMQHAISEDSTELHQMTSKHDQKDGELQATDAMPTAVTRLTMESGSAEGTKKWFDEESSYCYDLLGLQKITSVRWARVRPDESDSSSCSSGGSSISYPILSGNNGIKLDANNSGQGIDMLNMPSSAETAARQKSWMQIYFRYRINWYQAKPHLEKMSKIDAYKQENLNLWTRYVKISQHRKVPFLNSVRAFRNRIQCPGIQVRYTLNAFYKKGSENERAKNAGPLHPILLPLFRSPDDIAEFRKMAVAVINVFVTSDDTFFDDFWKECGSANGQ